MPKLSFVGTFSLLAVACLTIMVGCVIVPGLPSIAGELRVGSAASWLVTVPSLGVILFGPLAAKMTERIGLYTTLCFGLFAYGLLGVVGFLLQGPLVVFADRLVLGGATAMIMAAGTGLISEFYEGQNRLRMIARQGMSIELGGVIFLSIGGVLASVGWKLPFLLYLISWVLLVMVLAFIPRPERHHQAAHAKTTNVTLPVPFKVVLGAAVISMSVFFTAIILLPVRLQTFRLSESQIGYFLSFISLVAVGGAAVMPRAVRKLGDYGTLAIAFTFYGLAHLAFVTADGLTLMIEGGVSLGLGFGLSIPLVNHMTVEQSDTHQRGRNLAYLSMAIFSGQFLSSFMEFLPGGQSVVFICTAVIAMVTGALVLVAHKRRWITSVPGLE